MIVNFCIFKIFQKIVCQKIFFLYNTPPLSLYRNEFKIWEFGKEAPQNFDPERATIAERQGASEDQNYEAKPTRPKTKF
jgi:hypothetical protein